MTEKLIVKRETRELKILTRPRLKEKKFCESCQAEVRWLFPEEAMALAETTLRGIFRLVESHDIHFAESEEGFLIVCAESMKTK